MSSQWLWVDDAAGDDFDTRLTNAIATVTAGSTSGIVVIGRTGSPHEYSGATPITVPKEVTLIFQDGQIDLSSATGNLTIEGPIVAADTADSIFIMPTPTDWESGCYLKIRHEAGTGPYSAVLADYMNPYVPYLSAQWFDDGDADDYAARINKAVAAGGYNAVVRIPAGIWYIRTTIDLDNEVTGYAPKAVVIEGVGFRSSILVIASGVDIVGLNLHGSRECDIRHLRILGASPTEDQCAILLGGTTTNVHHCWFGNAKYGVLMCRGAGLTFTSSVVEICQYGLCITPGLTDGAVATIPGGNSVYDVRISDINTYGGTAANLYIWQSGYFARSILITNCAFKNCRSTGRNVHIEAAQDHGIGVTFVNCSMYGGDCVAPDATTDEYFGGSIKNAQVTWIGGAIFDNPDYGEYRRYALLDCDGTDVTNWGVGDEVGDNDTGLKWAGEVFLTNSGGDLGADDLVVVYLVARTVEGTPVPLTDVDDIIEADGIENTDAGGGAGDPTTAAIVADSAVRWTESEEKCGMYIYGTKSLVKFIGVTRGNWGTTETSQDKMFKVGSAGSHVVDIEGIELDVFLPVTSGSGTNDVQDASHRINAADRWPGKQIWDSTNLRPLWSDGYDATDPWCDAAGITVYTPS